MSLREQLEAKTRRHVDHPVLVRDPAVADRAVQVAGAELLAASRPGADPGEQEAAEAALAAADAARAACVVTVGFDALDPDVYDALVAEHLDVESGELDHASLLPVLAARCAVDPDLRDPVWWAAQLSSGVWTSGERDALDRALYLLHRAVPAEALGKG